MVGWKIGPDVVFLAEGNAADTGTAITWAQRLGECGGEGKGPEMAILLPSKKEL